MATPTISPLEQLEQQQAPAPTQQASTQAAQTAPSQISPLEQLEQQQAQTPRSPEDEQSNTRQMLVSGLTGMPTPNMTAQEQQQFQQGKVAGAVSVPIVAGGTLAATIAPEIAGYMGHIDNILKVAKSLGWAGFGIKEAADVYKTVKGLASGK